MTRHAGRGRDHRGDRAGRDHATTRPTAPRCRPSIHRADRVHDRRGRGQRPARRTPTTATSRRRGRGPSIEVDGDAATADVAFTGGASTARRSPSSLVNEDDQWKLDALDEFIVFDKACLRRGARRAGAAEAATHRQQVVDCVERGVQHGLRRGAADRLPERRREPARRPVRARASRAPERTLSAVRGPARAGPRAILAACRIELAAADQSGFELEQLSIGGSPAGAPDRGRRRPGRAAARRPEPAAARGRHARRGAAAGAGRRRLGQDAGADPPRRLAARDRPGAARTRSSRSPSPTRPREEMRERVAHAGRRRRAADVGDDLPRRLRAPAADGGRAPRLHAAASRSTTRPTRCGC